MVRFIIGNNSRAHLTFATVAASTMFIWDYILTFRMEVDLVWKSKWNIMKGLYLLQRYLPFIDTTWLVLYCQSDAISILLPSLFCRSDRRWVDEGFMSECILRRWRSVKFICLTLTQTGKYLILLLVTTSVGLAASDSRLYFHFLFRVC